MKIELNWKQFKLEEGVSIMLKPLSTEAYQTLLGTFNFGDSFEMTDEKKNQIAMQFNPLTNPKIVDIIKQILPNHSKDLVGIIIAENNTERNATIEDLVTIPQLTIMAVNILSELMQMSTVSGGEREEVKKSLVESSVGN